MKRSGGFSVRWVDEDVMWLKNTAREDALNHEIRAFA